MPRPNVFTKQFSKPDAEKLVAAFEDVDAGTGGGVTPMTFNLDSDANLLRVEHATHSTNPPNTQQTSVGLIQGFFGPQKQAQDAPLTLTLIIGADREAFGSPDFTDPTTGRAKDVATMAAAFGAHGMAASAMAANAQSMVRASGKISGTTLSKLSKLKKMEEREAAINKDMIEGSRQGGRSAFTPTVVSLYEREDGSMQQQVKLSVKLFVKRTTGSAKKDCKLFREGSSLHDYQMANPTLMPNNRFMFISQYDGKSVSWTNVLGKQPYDSIQFYGTINFAPAFISISEKFDRFINLIFVNHITLFAVLGSGKGTVVPDHVPLTPAQALVSNAMFQSEEGANDEDEGEDEDEDEEREDDGDSAHDGLVPASASKRLKIEDE